MSWDTKIVVVVPRHALVSYINVTIVMKSIYIYPKEPLCYVAIFLGHPVCGV